MAKTVLVKSRFQAARWEGNPYSSGVEVSELADEGEQGHARTNILKQNVNV